MRSIFRFQFILLLAAICTYAQELTIVSSSDNALRFTYRPVLTDSSVREINGKTYLRYNFLNTSLPAELKSGDPALPVRSVPVGVPGLEQNLLKIHKVVTRDVKGRILPIPTAEKVNGTREPVYKEGAKYSRDEYLPGTFATIVSSGITRGIGVAEVTLAPVRCNSESHSIEIVEELEVEIIFTKKRMAMALPKDGLLEGAVINIEQTRNWISVFSPFEKMTAQNSVLSTGKWFRFEAKTEGIYRINRDMIAALGVNPDDIDPTTIKIYNNGGYPLPEGITVPRPIDLVENAIFVVGEEDRKLNSTDYILFYGRGVNFWYYDSVSSTIIRNRSPYTFENYYWITWGGNPGKRIQQKQSLNTTGAIPQTTSDAYISWEQDKLNIGKTGRDFLGDEFSESVKSRTYTSKLDGLNTAKPVSYAYRFVNASSPSVSFQIEESGVSRVAKSIPGFGGYEYSYGEAETGAFSYSGPFSDDRSVLRITFSAAGAGTFGYLDYFEIKYNRNLTATDNGLQFFSNGTAGTFEYRLSGFTPAQVSVFDITDHANVKMITNVPPPSGSTYVFQAAEPQRKITRYYALEPQAYKTPVNFKEAQNQNIHGISGGAKHIIVTPLQFKEQAERLRKYRATEAKLPLSSIVVFTEEIYNEFSNGAKEPTAIRDFLRFAYLNWAVTPEYVLLFGDGDYDYRNIEGNNLNNVPAYQTQESLDEIYSFNTDDFYARVDGNDYYLDLAFGRIPIQSQADAVNAVNKIIDYERSTDFSMWRNRVTLVADDGFTSRGSGEDEHTTQSEALSTYSVPQSFDAKKIYLSDYPTTFTSLGRRKPEVNNAIVNAINEGTLFLNYYGHGSPELWAHEQVFVKDETFPLLKNKNYFFLTAATCDFGYFDKTSGQSASEALILKPNSGAIGVISASRPVFSSPNHALNTDIYNALLLSNRDTMNLPITVGKAFFQAKRYKIGDNDLKFHLFCDPALRLAIPQHTGFVDSINGQPAAVSNITVKALQKLSIRGRISLDGNTATSAYNGAALLTVYDSDRFKNLPEFGSSFMIKLQGGTIFRGGISVENGKYNAEFLVPRDISLESQTGKIVLYYNNGTTDGMIFSRKIIFSGIDTSMRNDGAGPNIQVAFDNANNTDAYLVNPTSTLIAKLSDESGLNTTGNGIGHKMLAIINNNQREPIDLTSFFTADMNSGGKSGKAEYPLQGLAEGEYQLELKAWDVFNNPGFFKTSFKVTNTTSLEIDNVYNYPNPFHGSTTFVLDHNSAEPVNIKIRIFSVAGRTLQTIEKNAVTERNIKLEWDGRDKDGDALANGTYLYKVTLTGMSGTTRFLNGKLAIIR